MCCLMIPISLSRSNTTRDRWRMLKKKRKKNAITWRDSWFQFHFHFWQDDGESLEVNYTFCTYIVDDFVRARFCCVRIGDGTDVLGGCTYLYVSFTRMRLLRYKDDTLISETATKLARSSSVDVLHVRLRVYTFSAVVVPEKRNEQSHQYVLSELAAVMQVRIGIVRCSDSLKPFPSYRCIFLH